MKHYSPASSLIFTVGYVAVGVALAAPATSALQADQSDQMATPTEKLFGKHCAKCHGADGRARKLRGRLVGARNLTDPRWQERVSDDQIRAAIENGPKEMPSFADRLSKEEIDSLVQYVRHFKRDRADPNKSLSQKSELGRT